MAFATTALAALMIAVIGTSYGVVRAEAITLERLARDHYLQSRALKAQGFAQKFVPISEDYQRF